MKKIEKYYYVKMDETGKETVVRPDEANCIGGRVYGHDKFPDGSLITTSQIRDEKGDRVMTENFSVYHLGAMHPDYADYLEAVKADIPVITDWALTGFFRSGYNLTGETEEGRKISGKVIAQDGNYITLSQQGKYFVLWRNMKAGVKEAKEFGQYLDFDCRKGCGDFDNVMELECRPRLFPKMLPASLCW